VKHGKESEVDELDFQHAIFVVQIFLILLINFLPSSSRPFPTKLKRLSEN